MDMLTQLEQLQQQLEKQQMMLNQQLEQHQMMINRQLEQHQMMINQQLEQQQMMVEHMLFRLQMMENHMGLPEKNEEKDTSMFDREYTQTKKHIEEVQADIACTSKECNCKNARIKKHIEEARRRIQRDHGEFDKRFREISER